MRSFHVLAWCRGCFAQEECYMTDKTKRYFDRMFKLPFAKSLEKAGKWQLPVIPPCRILPKGVVAYDQIVNAERFVRDVPLLG